VFLARRDAAARARGDGARTMRTVNVR